MKDRKGNPVEVGDRVYVLPDKQTRSGGFGWVRRIAEGKARVDDGDALQSTLSTDDSWTWSAWVTPDEVETMTNPSAPTRRAGER